jgi:hypothetical protein
VKLLRWLPLILIASLAQASTFFGAVGGVSFVNQDVGGEATIGLEGGTDICTNVDLGLHLTWLNLSTGGNQTIVTPKLEYHQHTDGSGFLVGALGGVGITKNRPYYGSSAGFIFGPEAGYRILLPSDFTAGVNINALHSTNSGELNLYSALITFSYWFY